ncbi:MAG: phosphatidate cytidylyltransferase [Solirubrobacterales bacterium]
MNNRYIGALVLSPFVIFLFLGGIVLKYIVLALSLGGMYELYKVSRVKGINPISYAGYGLCIIYYIMLGKSTAFDNIFLITIISLLILFCIPVFDTKYNYLDIAVTILSFLYIPIFFSFIVLVENMEYGNYFVWLIFISAWMSDTSAYYAGKFFGRHKLCPKVSPKKTIEGSIGGIIGSAAACGAFGAFIINHGVDVQLIHFVAIGVIAGAISQFGDLTASSIKRYSGVKDYSNLIPGHGGILDRFDSILFSSVIVFYYLYFVLNFYI